MSFHLEALDGRAGVLPDPHIQTQNHQHIRGPSGAVGHPSVARCWPACETQVGKLDCRVLAEQITKKTSTPKLVPWDVALAV